MLRREIRVMVIVGAGLLWALVPGQAPTPLPLSELAEERIRLARAALDELDRGEASGTSVRLADRTPWLRRIAETRREHGGGPNEVLADLRAYAAHLASLDVQLSAEADSRVALDEVRYARMEVAAWLVEASGGERLQQVARR